MGINSAAAVADISFKGEDFDSRRQDALMHGVQTFARVAHASGSGFAPARLGDVCTKQEKWVHFVDEVPSYIGMANILAIRENPPGCSLPRPQLILLWQQQGEWFAQYGMGRSCVQLVWDVCDHPQHPDRIRLAIGTYDVDIVDRCEAAHSAKDGDDRAPIDILKSEFPERFAALTCPESHFSRTFPCSWNMYYDDLLG